MKEYKLKYTEGDLVQYNSPLIRTYNVVYYSNGMLHVSMNALNPQKNDCFLYVGHEKTFGHRIYYVFYALKYKTYFEIQSSHSRFFKKVA